MRASRAFGVRKGGGSHDGSQIPYETVGCPVHGFMPRRGAGVAVRFSTVLALVTLMWLAAGTSGASARAANCFATYGTNCYGAAWFQPGQQLYGGYVRMFSSELSLGCFECDALDDDFWAYESSSFKAGGTQVFIESGIVVGTFCGDNSCSPPIGPYRDPRYFWGDSRAGGGGLHEHVDVNGSDYPPPEGTNSAPRRCSARTTTTISGRSETPLGTCTRGPSTGPRTRTR